MNEMLFIERGAVAQRLAALRVMHAAGVDPASRTMTDMARAEGFGRPEVRRVGGLAVVPVSGPIIFGGSWIDYLFDEAVDGRALATTLTDLAAERSVERVLLDVASPGGTCVGMDDLAAAVAAVRAAGKPIEAAAHDAMHSAAYWLAAECDRVYATGSALVGSIGTYLTVLDMSAMFEEMGLKTVLVSSGGVKGQGSPGVPVSPEYVESLRALVMAVNARFLAAVGRGRRLNAAQVEALATGQCWTAQQAMELGLVDEVVSFDALVQRLADGGGAGGGPRPGAAAARSAASSSKGARAMGDENKAGQAAGAQPATLAELKSEYPGAGGDFYVACLEEGLTLAQAGKKRIAALEQQGAERLKAQAAELEAARARAEQAEKALAEQKAQAAERSKVSAAVGAAGVRPGVAPVGHGESTATADGGGKHPYLKEIDRVMAERKMSRAAATALVAKERTDLYRAYLTGNAVRTTADSD